MTDMAEPHNSSLAVLSCPEPPGPSSRWMMEGRAGVAFTRNGNSSMTAVRGWSRTAPKSNAIASPQS